tara:strand:+ start:693 stop:1403 length:711 start_codon:yes stop_codon:yes gene_type:complete
LKRFPKTEWSGPAWYKLEEDEWNLVYFIPIDLGSHSATEFEGKDLLKIMKEVQKTVDITGCYQGIIHSHHNMGAFHSGTDDTELKDGANRVGYPSLVVAHTGATHAFKWSYQDQFGEVHLVDGNVTVETPEFEPIEEWVKQADKIEEEAKKKPKVVNTMKYYNGNQGTLWKGTTDGARVNGWGNPWIDPSEIEYNQAYEKMENAQALFDEGKMTKKKYNKVKKKWEEFEKDHFGII